MRAALRAIARTTAINFTVIGVLAAVLLGGLASQGKESVFRPTVVNANTLMAEHGCSDEVQDPTHAVVTIKGQTTRYVGQRLTNLAIEQAVFGVDHGLVVHGFCS
jgi:hypothetical protein